MSRCKQIALVAVAIGLLAAPAQADEPMPTRIQIGTEGAFAPWNFMKPDGTVAGFEIDLANDLCGRMHVSCTITPQNFDGLIPALNAGKIDAIMAAMSITPKRQDVIAFSMPYAVSGQGFATTKGSSLQDMPDLAKMFTLNNEPSETMAEIDKLKPFLHGKTIGVQGGAIAEFFVNKYLQGAATFRLYKTTEQFDIDLINGRLDGTFTSPAYIETSMKKPGNEAMVQTGPRFSGGLLGLGSGVGMRKTEVPLQAAFNAAIQSAKADGTIKTLAIKWFGFDVTPIER